MKLVQDQALSSALGDPRLSNSDGKLFQRALGSLGQEKTHRITLLNLSYLAFLQTQMCPLRWLDYREKLPSPSETKHNWGQEPYGQTSSHTSWFNSHQLRQPRAPEATSWTSFLGEGMRPP